MEIFKDLKSPEIQKFEIVEAFTKGETIAELANKFSCTKLTISRNLRKTLGEYILIRTL